MTFLEDADAMDLRAPNEKWLIWSLSEELDDRYKTASLRSTKITWVIWFLLNFRIKNPPSPALITQHSVLFVYPRGSKSRSSNAVLLKRSAHQGPQDRSFDLQSSIGSTRCLTIVVFPTTGFELVLDKMAEITYFLDANLLFYIFSPFMGAKRLRRG